MDDTERECRTLHLQVIRINAENKGNHMETMMVTNHIEEAILGNNCKFTEDYKAIHACINCKAQDHTHLKKQIQELCQGHSAT